MKKEITTSHYSLVFVLAGLIALTRFHPPASPLDLPDASLAVFFLTGCWLRPTWPFAALFVVAAAIDYLAVTYGGVSGDCFSPAYWFLIPTYACLWYGGRRYAVHYRGLAWSSLPPLLIALWTTASLAFLISNASFFLFSGHFPGMSGGHYALSVAKYYPPYVAGAFGYVAAAFIAQGIWVAIAGRRGTSAADRRYGHE